MPDPILVAVICVAVLAIYISVQTGLRTAFDRHVRLFLLYLAVDATHTWIVRKCFSEHILLDYFAPYGLLYGPFLFFGYQVAIDKPIRVRPVLLHVIPFVVFLSAYLLWLVAPKVFDGYEHDYGLILSSSIAVSLVSYSMWALFFRPTRTDEQGNEEVRTLSTMVMVLAFVAVVYLAMVYSRMGSPNIRSQLSGAVVFLGMLGASIILFSYVLRRALRRTEKPDAADPKFTEPQPNATDSSPATDARYQKSALPTDVLDAYEASTRELVENRQVYLDEGLSLASLAQQLRIPKHHLSQVLSL